MNHKILTIIFGMILLVGIVTMLTGFVSANRIIDNPTAIYIENFIAGSEVQANFSYDYLRDRPENPDNSPLILRLNITSTNSQYPVWKGDFEINGFIKRYILFGLIPIGEKPFTCSEQASQTIIHPLGIEPVSAENGTFYCYNPEGHLDFEDFNAHDKVFLNIKSHPALWPGEYSLSAELYYLIDTYPPIVNILDKSYFDQYFKDGSYVDFQARITDGSGLYNYYSKIFTPLENFSFSKELVSGDIYHFYYPSLPITIPEGNHPVKVVAIDLFGNNATDNTIIKIDRTPPEIKLIQPNASKVYSEILPIEANVTDEKAGVNNQSVYYRLREIINGTICPEIGIPVGNYSCTRTDWLNLPYDETTKTFKIAVNTTELNLTSGEYWFEAKAEDILGNIGILE